MTERIAVLTGGGDCPGLNAVIRAVTKKAILEYDMEVIGIEDGYEGLIHNRHRKLHYDDVSGILTMGGTILGTSNTANPYKYAVQKNGKQRITDVSRTVIGNLKRLNVDCLICIGGDGTLNSAYKLYRDGIPVIGIPKTIDNDLIGTDVTFGFATAVSIATEGIDRIHTTAQSHHRVMIVEVMGRKAGWIALYSGVAGGGDIILIPEIPYDINVIAQKVKERNRKGKKCSIIVIAEGAKPKGGSEIVKKIVKDGSEPCRLGGVSFILGDQIENITGIETRAVVMGHLLRGGTPVPLDRVLATELGTKAMDLLKNKEYGHMVGVKGTSLIKVPLEDVAKGFKAIPLDYPLVRSARSLGASFGDGK